MSYQQAGNAINSERFICRVEGCVIELAAAVMAAITGSGSIQDDALNDLTTTACQTWATNYIKGVTATTNTIIGKWLLLNATLAADPFGNGSGDDAAMNWQLKHVYLNLVAIG
jgi:hypothetical protein